MSTCRLDASSRGPRRRAANLIMAFTMLVVHVNSKLGEDWDSEKSLVVVGVADMTLRYHSETQRK